MHRVEVVQDAEDDDVDPGATGGDGGGVDAADLLDLGPHQGGQVAAARLLATGHTAIICGSDLMALGVIREAHSRGLRVPEDLSVIGFDDSPLMAFADPPLTTVRQPVQAMCEAAVSGLVRAMDGNTPDGTELVFRPDLIIRQSTGPKT